NAWHDRDTASQCAGAPPRGDSSACQAVSAFEAGRHARRRCGLPHPAPLGRLTRYGHGQQPDHPHRRRPPELPALRAGAPRGGRVRGRRRGRGRCRRAPGDRSAPTGRRAARRAASRHGRLRRPRASRAGEAAGRPRLEPRGLRLQRPDPLERRTRLHREGRVDGRRCSLPPAVTRRRLAAAVLVGTALYAVAIYLVVTADLGEPRALITMVTVAGLIFSVAGTIAAIQRPDNRTGAQMLAVGLLWSVGALQLADSPLVFTIGYLLSGLAFVAFAHLILSYPSGRLRPGDEWIVWAVLAIVTLGPLAISLFDRSPIPACDDCPESAFLVTDSTALARAAGSALGLAAAGIATVVFVRLIRRFRAASPPLRRALGPVYFFTLIALVGLVTSNLAWTFDENAGLAIEIAALAALALMPVAFLAGILRTRLQRAGIADLVIALGNGRPLRDALADALGDPSLGLAYWSSQRQAWVDEEGRTMAEPIARGAHARACVENDGKRVAALLHDRSLTDQRPLVDAVAATAGLAFEKERL